MTTPVLWPPNHQLVNVGLSVQVSDPGATVKLQVFANDGALSSDAANFAPGKLAYTANARAAATAAGGGRRGLLPGHAQGPPGYALLG